MPSSATKFATKACKGPCGGARAITYRSSRRWNPLESAPAPEFRGATAGAGHPGRVGDGVARRTPANRVVGVRDHLTPRGRDRRRPAEAIDGAAGRARMLDIAVPTGVRTPRP